MVLTKLRKGFDRFLDALDSEGVGLFQVVVYLHMILCGLYCLFVARGVPQVVGEVLGPGVEKVWLWLFVGMVACLVGKSFLANPQRTRFWVYTTGLWMQLSGDMFALFGFTGYVLATLQTGYWGKAMVGLFGFAAYAWCALFLCVRDARRINQAERKIRR